MKASMGIKVVNEAGKKYLVIFNIDDDLKDQRQFPTDEEIRANLPRGYAVRMFDDTCQNPYPARPLEGVFAVPEYQMVFELEPTSTAKYRQYKFSEMQSAKARFQNNATQSYHRAQRHTNNSGFGIVVSFMMVAAVTVVAIACASAGEVKE